MNKPWAAPVVLLALLLGLPGANIADAGQGEMAGFRLGDRYPVQADTPMEAAADRSWKIRAAGPAPTHEQDAVYLYVTPVTHTIGKIVRQRAAADIDAAAQLAATAKTRLEERYPDWERLRAPIPMGRTGGAMVSRLRKGPYALIVFYRGTAKGAEVAEELEFESASPERKAWRALLRDEATAP
jgi:hypothetical protein